MKTTTTIIKKKTVKKRDRRFREDPATKPVRPKLGALEGFVVTMNSGKTRVVFQVDAGKAAIEARDRGAAEGEAADEAFSVRPLVLTREEREAELEILRAERKEMEDALAAEKLEQERLDREELAGRIEEWRRGS